MSRMGEYIRERMEIEMVDSVDELCDFDEESEGGEKGRRVGRLEVTDKDIQLVILHALLSAGWNPDGALIESVRLAEKFNLS